MPKLPFSTEFRIATEKGDHPASRELLTSPVLLDTGHPHPDLRMADYFASVAAFFHNCPDTERRCEQASRKPEEALGERAPQLTVVSEKIGALYHVARVEMRSPAGAVVFAVNTALSDAGKSCLERDYRLLRLLENCRAGNRLPKALAFQPADDNNPAPEARFSHFLAEWQDDFHEWHATNPAADGRQRLSLWDRRRGAAILNADESSQIINNAAAILTGCFDFASRKAVWDWHHAAGDFIVRRAENGIEVRLITVRDFRSCPFRPDQAEVPLILDLLLFFLDLTFRMRLDKLDGVGETVWLDDSAAVATAAGFFDTLAERARTEPIAAELGPQLRHICRGFTEDELAAVASPVLAGYDELLSAADRETIEQHRAAHLKTLRRHLQAQK